MAVSGVRARAVLLALVIVAALVPGPLPSALTTGPAVTWTDPIEGPQARPSAGHGA